MMPMFRKQQGVVSKLTSTNTLTEMVLSLIVDRNGFGSSIYGIPGAAWYQADKDIQTFITNQALTYVHASNESSALYMAAFEGLSLNKVGVTFSTAGPGTLMAATGIGTAMYEANPLVSFFGVPDVDFQYIDTSMFAKICKRVFYIDASTLNPQIIVSDAFIIAQKGTPQSPGKGPVAIFVLDSCWFTPYRYTRFPRSTLTYPTRPMMPFIKRILTHVKPTSKIIIRLGERVDPSLVKKLADMSNVYTNLFIMLTLLSKTYINHSNYPNVGIDGPLANPTINNLYRSASLVIDVGDGINYSLLLYTDVYPYMTQNTPLYYVLNSPTQYPPGSSTRMNTLYVDVNVFLTNFLRYFVPFGTNGWGDARAAETLFTSTILNAYKSQTNANVMTTIAVVAHAFDAIYAQHIGIHTGMIIDDDLLYSTDVGLVSFLANSFIRLKTPMAISILGEFSAIGSSISVVAGYLRTHKYKGAVLVLGDGGFLNVPGYCVDLCKVLQENPDYSILILLMNDNCYTNVAQAEVKLFGTTTSITSTAELQVGLNLGTIASALFGDKLANYLELSDITTDQVSEFVTAWYTARPSGASILHYRTAVGQPFKITL